MIGKRIGTSPVLIEFDLSLQRPPHKVVVPRASSQRGSTAPIDRGVWMKVRNPASVAVQRERSENWNR